MIHGALQRVDDKVRLFNHMSYITPSWDLMDCIKVAVRVNIPVMHERTIYP